MLDIDFTFVWTAINLAILYLFLKKFLFGRVGQYMEDRARGIEEDMKRGQEMKAEGEAVCAEQRSLMEAATEKRRAILEEANKKASKEYEAIIADAKKEAARIAAAAREEAEREREQMLLRIRSDVASLALAAASRVIEENMDNEKNRRLIRDFLDKEDAA
jgi:F-type H+-transporting ATPase subunit b